MPRNATTIGSSRDGNGIRIRSRSPTHLEEHRREERVHLLEALDEVILELPGAGRDDDATVEATRSIVAPKLDLRSDRPLTNEALLLRRQASELRNERIHPDRLPRQRWSSFEFPNVRSTLLADSAFVQPLESIDRPVLVLDVGQIHSAVGLQRLAEGLSEVLAVVLQHPRTRRIDRPHDAHAACTDTLLEALERTLLRVRIASRADPAHGERVVLRLALLKPSLELPVRLVRALGRIVPQCFPVAFLHVGLHGLHKALLVVVRLLNVVVHFLLHQLPDDVRRGLEVRRVPAPTH